MKKIDTAMILAAGYGSRLRPLTDNLPKALVEFRGKPMIENVISKLEAFGIKNFIINTHHHHLVMEDYFENRRSSSSFRLIYEKEILGTGGAIKNAEKFLTNSADFIIYNADVDCDIVLDEFRKFHFAKASAVTLVVQKRESKRYLLTANNGELIGRIEDGLPVIFSKNFENNVIYEEKAFCGIHIVGREIFNYLKINQKIDIFPVYMSMLKQGLTISTFDITTKHWKDLGKLENL